MFPLTGLHQHVILELGFMLYSVLLLTPLTIKSNITCAKNIFYKLDYHYRKINCFQEYYVVNKKNNEKLNPFTRFFYFF